MHTSTAELLENLNAFEPASSLQIHLLQNLTFCLNKLSFALGSHKLFRDDFNLRGCLEDLLGAPLEIPGEDTCTAIIISLKCESLASLNPLCNIDVLLGVLKVVGDTILKSMDEITSPTDILWIRLSLAAANDLRATL